MSLMILKHVILEAFKDTLFEETIIIRIFLQKLEKKFAKNDKVEISMILEKLLSMKYEGKENIREYILKMSYFTLELKTLKLELLEHLCVHLVLISLLTQFSQFKVSYNY
ncbi:unnamed protein product [Spirodela intermedia]|uniref:Uncharacterized protein n=1 Tax=Spirodela intermedia TaxID=51605 RepID=A0A7I8KYI3_SPIIN|nr:unnamed protein product [Spirodela intermedia]